MKLRIQIDTEVRVMTVDVTDLPTVEEQLAACRQARLFAGMLFPHVAFLEVLRTPVDEREPVKPAASEA